MDAEVSGTLQQFLDVLPGATLVLRRSDDVWTVQIANAAAQRMNLVDAKGRFKVQDDPSWQHVADDLDRCLQLGAPLEVDERLGPDDAPTFQRWSMAPLPEAADTVIVSVADLTRARLAEQRAMRERERMAQSARIDSLTGSLSRRAFFLAADRVCRDLHRDGRRAAVILLDLDHFKQLNDTHGHDVGDRALVEVASACMATLRDHDLFGRLGGEEFAAVLLDVDLESARQVGERVRRAIRDTQIPIAGGRHVQVTASLGLTAWNWDDTRLSDVLARADKAMFIAKDRSRDVLAVWEELSLDDA